MSVNRSILKKSRHIGIGLLQFNPYDEPKWGGGGRGCGVSANAYSCAHGAKIIYGDLTLYVVKFLIENPAIALTFFCSVPTFALKFAKSLNSGK